MKRLNDKKVYSEIYEILNILGKEYINKLPSKLYQLIEEERDKNYIPILIIQDGNLNENSISQETIALFAVLNIKYFVDNKEEKSELMDIYRQNEIKHQSELQEKYNPNNLFKKEKLENSECTEIVSYKESIFKRIINKIKNIFFKESKF